MNDEELLRLPGTRMWDAIIAEKMGWTALQSTPKALWGTTPGGDDWRSIPHFASDWNDMRELVVFMKNRGWTWNIHHDRAGFVQRDQGFPEDCADSDRLALATVKAAVAALEWEASRA